MGRDDQYQAVGVWISRLTCEINATTAISNLSRANTTTIALKNLDCQLTINDCMTELSSFKYLKNLPVDYLKSTVYS